jgi:hypothetical protein
MTQKYRFYQIVLVFILAMGSAEMSVAQEKGALSLELAGVGGFGCLSYQKEFYRFDRFGLEYRAGLSFVPIDRNNGNAFVFPVLAHATYGNGRHMADLGLGQTVTVTTRGSLFLRLPTSFGYRFQTNGRMFYRIAYTPIISYLYNAQWEHWGGMTVGFNLGKK